MIFFYYIFFVIVLVLTGPVLLLYKAKARPGLWQKFGAVPPAIAGKIDAGKSESDRPGIWFHAVSVGEFNAIYPLIKAFAGKHQQYRLYVSTTTATGQKIAQDKVGDLAAVFYFPFDLPFAINNWLDRLRPELVVIAETELWPGFSYECQRRGVKLALVNGRISPRSLRGYLRFKWLFSRVLSGFSAIGVQSEQEALAYGALGAPICAVQVCGNMKIDGISALSNDQRTALRRSLHLGDADMVIVAGSTHEGEESALLSALAELPQSCRLILVPRHPERFDRVCQVVESHGCRARRYSRNETIDDKNDVYVLDSVGQLTAFYGLAAIAFVGGTIAPIGGHSLIEPFAYNVPVVCGPHTEKTRDIAGALLQRQALLQVAVGDLGATLLALCQSESMRGQYGAAGRRFIDENQGAVANTLAMLERVLVPTPVLRQQDEPVEQAR